MSCSALPSASSDCVTWPQLMKISGFIGTIVARSDSEGGASLSRKYRSDLAVRERRLDPSSYEPPIRCYSPSAPRSGGEADEKERRRSYSSRVVRAHLNESWHHATVELPAFARAWYSSSIDDFRASTPEAVLDALAKNGSFAM